MLTSKRLRLRDVTEGDCATVEKLLTTENVMTYIPSFKMDKDQIRALVDSLVKNSGS